MHPIQTESSTDLSERVERPCVETNGRGHALFDNPAFRCFAKAFARNEPTFTLRGQDVTAPLVVAFWVKLQQKVRELMDAGCTMTEAVERAEQYYFLEAVEAPASDAKLSGALLVARAMGQWKNRKLAD